MSKPVYKDLSLIDVDREIRSLFSGSGDHGDQKPIVFQTGHAPQTISSWLGESSERHSPIATGLLLQCAIDRAFPKKGDRVWQIIHRFRTEMLGLGRSFHRADELPEQILFVEFQEKWTELMARMQQMNLSPQQKQRFFLRARGLVQTDEQRIFGAIEIDEFSHVD
ncbi:MAG: hypothetical protein M3209_09725 [Acidobacteriota bacterium]|nr:hypothetical protein [Acidobacteriota bacterium]